MDPVIVTRLVLLLNALLLIAYDSWVEYAHGSSATISDVMRAWGYDMPWLLVVFGALCWHFWGTVPGNR